MKLKILKVSRKEGNYTNISNSLLHDPDLSFEAKSFCVIVLSLSPNWDFSIAGIAKYIGKSKQWVNKVLNELIDKGLCIREQFKTAEGKFSASQYTFIEKHSNNRIAPLSKCGSQILVSQEGVKEEQYIPLPEKPNPENRVPENHVPVLKHNTRTVESNNCIETKESLLSTSSSSKTKVLTPSNGEMASHSVDRGKLIEPPWHKTLPLEECAIAFIWSAELMDVRKQLITNTELKR